MVTSATAVVLLLLRLRFARRFLPEQQRFDYGGRARNKYQTVGIYSLALAAEYVFLVHITMFS